MMRSSVDLPPPLGPSSAVSWPLATEQVDVLERDEVAEPLGDAGRFDAHDERSFLRRIDTVAIARTVMTIRTNDSW